MRFPFPINTAPFILAALFGYQLTALVRADCAPGNPSIPETFEQASLVVRVQLQASQAGNLPCGVVVYDTLQGQYAAEDTNFTVYTVLEIFKDAENNVGLEVGDEIKILHDTDTGFYKSLPDYLLSDTQDGFLAFLSPHRFCDESLESSWIPVDETVPMKETPFLLNECVIANQAWSSVPVEDRELLRDGQGAVTSAPSDGPNSATPPPTSSPSASTNPAPAPSESADVSQASLTFKNPRIVLVVGFAWTPFLLALFMF